MNKVSKYSQHVAVIGAVFFMLSGAPVASAGSLVNFGTLQDGRGKTAPTIGIGFARQSAGVNLGTRGGLNAVAGVRRGSSAATGVRATVGAPK